MQKMLGDGHFDIVSLKNVLLLLVLFFLRDV